MKKTIILAFVVVVIVFSIFYLEKQNVNVSTENITVQEVSIQEIANQTEPNTRVLEKELKYKKAIELVNPDGYVNVDNITISELIGKKIIIIDFWTYSCINCQRTLPYLTAWYSKYKEGLVIIGVHTPEFDFEKDHDNLIKATQKFGVEYPVVQDNNYYTWRAYGNRYWPRKYIIDIDGFIVYDHIGEGAYAETEMTIQELLKERADVFGLNETYDMKLETTALKEFKSLSFGQTSELYAGYSYALERGQDVYGGFKQDIIYDYVMPEKILNDIIYLNGSWKSIPDQLIAKSDKSSLALSFSAKEVNIVATGKGKVYVKIDDKYLTSEQAGKDIAFEGEKSYFNVEDPNLYNIYEGNNVRAKLQLYPEKDFSFNSFTFG